MRFYQSAKPLETMARQLPQTSKGGNSMYNETAYALGSVRSYIREVFEYGRQQSKIVGEENVFA